MKSKLKKSLSLLLALVMAMSCMSLGAFATVTTEADTGAVASAEVNGVKTYYTTLQEAINAAFNGGTVTLLKDVTVAHWHQNLWCDTQGPQKLTHASDVYKREPTQGPKDLTINGNGHTLQINNVYDSGTNGSSILANAENLTVKNLTIIVDSGKGFHMKSGLLKSVSITANHPVCVDNLGSNCESEEEYDTSGSQIAGVTIVDSVLDGKNGKVLYDNELGKVVNLKISNSTLRTTSTSTFLNLRTNEILENCKIESGEGGKITLSNDGTIDEKDVKAVASGAKITGNDFGVSGLKVYSNYNTLDATITGNIFSSTAVIKRDDNPEQVDLSGNYWGGSKPSFDAAQYATYSSWYTATEKTNSTTGAKLQVKENSLVSNAAADPGHVAQIGDTPYDTVEAAVAAVNDSTTPITVNEATTIAGVEVAANSTVTVTETANPVSSTVENATATVTPKTLTISKDGEETKTAMAYVVSNDSKSSVVTDVAKDSTFTNETSSTSVESYVNVAQVLANAVAAKNIDVSSISSMTLRLSKTEDKSTTVSGTDNGAKTALQTAITSGTAYEVHPEAVVTTKTTEGSTTTTNTITYDASKEVTGSFTFKLHVSDNEADTYKTAKLTHYHNENGTWTATPIPNLIVDSNGDVTVTLDKFSYITVDGVDYEVFGEITKMGLMVGSDNSLTYTFALTDSGKQLSNPHVKLKIDGVGYLNAVSESDYNASRVTVYTQSVVDGVYTLKIKVFAMYMNAPVYVELWDGDSQMNIQSYSRPNSSIEEIQNAQVGKTFGYSLLQYLGYYAAVNGGKYQTLYEKMGPYAEAAALFR